MIDCDIFDGISPSDCFLLAYIRHISLMLSYLYSSQFCRFLLHFKLPISCGKVDKKRLEQQHIGDIYVDVTFK